MEDKQQKIKNLEESIKIRVWELNAIIRYIINREGGPLDKDRELMAESLRKRNKLDNNKINEYLSEHYPKPYEDNPHFYTSFQSFSQILFQSEEAGHLATAGIGNFEDSYIIIDNLPEDWGHDMWDDRANGAEIRYDKINGHYLIYIKTTGEYCEPPVLAKLLEPPATEDDVKTAGLEYLLETLYKIELREVDEDFLKQRIRGIEMASGWK